MSKEVISTNGNTSINFWDTSGKELTNKILSSQIYKSADCFIVLCSYDSLSSLNNLSTWLDYLKKYTDQNGITTLPIFIVFNKFDKKKQFTTADIKNKLNELMTSYEEFNFFVSEFVSVKENFNLNFLFENIIIQLSGDSLKNDSSFYNYSERYRSQIGRSFKLEGKCVACRNANCC
jgi:GTPase SAR1 family protein